MAKQDLVFIGIRGSVVPFDKKQGARVWETKLKGSAFVCLMVDDGHVFAGTQGEAFCLDAATGQILWHDGLKGYGYGMLSIATAKGSSDSPVAAAEADRRQQETSSAVVTSTAVSAS
jgi:outer membrane protein assembly factor BamB